MFLSTQSLVASEDDTSPYNIKANKPVLSLINGQSGQSLVPYMDYMVDISGMTTLLELFSPSYEKAFIPLEDGIPVTETGSTWLRLSIVPDSTTTHVIALGTELATDVKLYIPEFGQYIENRKNFSESLNAPSGIASKTDVATPWHEITIPHGEAITLPTLSDPELLQQIKGVGVPIYIHMAGTPEPWFTPQLRTITDIAHDNSHLIHFGISMMLAAVLALCLVRAFTEKGQWRFWTTFFTASLLLQSLIGLPITPHGSIDLSGLAHVLAPAIALMLLPHIARHMLQRTSFSPKYVPALGSHLDGDLDRQYRFLSIPCILIAVLPLLPSMGWLGKLLPLWPLAIIFFMPTTLMAVLRGISGAKLFLLGCSVALLSGLCAGLAMLLEMPAILINAMPLCGTALCALIIAGAGNVHSALRSTKEQQAEGIDQKSGITIREDYDDPLLGEGLRLVPAEEGLATGIVLHDESDDMDSQIVSVRVISPKRERNPEDSNEDCSPDTEHHTIDEALSPTESQTNDTNLSKTPEKAQGTSTDSKVVVQEVTPSGTLASSLRSPLSQDDVHTLTRAEEAMRYPLETLRKNMDALQKCSLHPDTQKLCDEISMVSKQLDLVGEEFRRATYRLPAEQNTTIFHLQRCLREAHDNVCAQSDAKNIALSWFMAPHLVPTYEGDADRLRTTLRVLMESAVDATETGSVYLSARRVPESTNPGHLLFTITDTGAGGPPDKRKASALMQAWELATSTGGSLSIDSGLHGTTISFSTRFLAIHSDSTPACHGDMPRTKRDAHGNGTNSSVPHKYGRIIIGAPATSNRQLLAFYLEDTAYYGNEALSSLDVMGKYTSDGADLIILDSDMMEGEIAKIIETIRQYEAEHELSPVPFLALVRDEAQADALLHMGCTQTLLKPVTRSGLCAQVALLAPIVVTPLPPEPTSLDHTQSEPEQSQPIHVDGDAVHLVTTEDGQALTPDMISSTLAEAMELLTAPASPQEVAKTTKVSRDNPDVYADAQSIREAHAPIGTVDNIELTNTIEHGEAKNPDVPLSTSESATIHKTEEATQITAPVDAAGPVDLASPMEAVGPVESVPSIQEKGKAEEEQTSEITTEVPSSSHVPTSKAEDITLRIYDEYIQGGKSSVSSSMQDLDPILFTNIFDSPAQNEATVNTIAIAESTSDLKMSSTAHSYVESTECVSAPRVATNKAGQTTIIAPIADHATPQEGTYVESLHNDGNSLPPSVHAHEIHGNSDNSDFEPQVSPPRSCAKSADPTPMHDAPIPSQVTENIEKDTQAAEKIQGNAPELGFVYEDVESEVSTPRPVKNTDNTSTSPSATNPAVQHHISAESHTGRLPKSKPLERGNEVYVEEITVGTEVLRLYKVPTTSLDPDAEYEAMLQREAELAREQGDVPPVSVPQEAPIAPVQTAYVAQEQEELVASAETSHSVAEKHEATVEAPDSVDKIVDVVAIQEDSAPDMLQTIMAPPHLQAPRHEQSTAPTHVDTVALQHDDSMTPDPVDPVIELSHAINAPHDAPHIAVDQSPEPILTQPILEEPKEIQLEPQQQEVIETRIIQPDTQPSAPLEQHDTKESDSYNASGDDTEGYDDYAPDVYTSDGYAPDEYSLDEYDDAELNAAEEVQKPSAVARATAALLAVCNNLREPAPLRLKEKALPSLRKLRDAFETTLTNNNSVVGDANAAPTAHQEDASGASVESNTMANPHGDATQLFAEPANTASQEQGPRFVSIVQSVNEIAATIKPAASILRHSSQKDFVPKLITELEQSLAEANAAYDQGDVRTLHTSVARIADNAEVLGLRALERHARCVERAAQADDLGAARELYADMENVVHRTISALRTSGLSGAHRM